MRSLTLAAALGLILAASISLAQVTKCPAMRRHGMEAVPNMIEGEVSSVAPDRQLVSLREPGGEQTALHLSPETRIVFPDGNLASLSDLAEGQRVRASFRVNEAGQAVAGEVRIMGEVAAPPRRGMPAAPGPGTWKTP